MTSQKKAQNHWFETQEHTPQQLLTFLERPP